MARREGTMLLLALGVVACRPETYGMEVRVLVPTDDAIRHMLPEPQARVMVPEDQALPRGVHVDRWAGVRVEVPITPASRALWVAPPEHVKVLVPDDEPLNRGMRRMTGTSR